MQNQSEKIKCPKCGTEIDVNDLLYHQLEDELKQKYTAEFADKNKELEKRVKQIEDKEASLNDEVEKAVTAKLQSERKEIEDKLKKQIKEEQNEQIHALQAELSEKSNQVKELNKSKAEIERLKREKDELKEEIEAESERKFSEKLKEERNRITKDIESKNELKIGEKEEIIDQLRKQLELAQKKAEQGSSQLHGEIQELAIENWLRETFPLDTIDEIKKGAQGADCIQVVNTRTQSNCGKIYYESKRTKAFQPAWIEKFKADIREQKADIGVLVTEAMPSDMERMDFKDGIYICSFDEFKGLTAVLRQSIIQIQAVTSSQENKGTKMEMLYDFLTGVEFRQQIEAIVEGFTQMQSDLNAEKRAIQSHWKKREKQIEKVLLSTTGMYSSIKGIAGNAIKSVKQLEFNEDEDVDT